MPQIEITGPTARLALFTNACLEAERALTFALDEFKPDGDPIIHIEHALETIRKAMKGV